MSADTTELHRSPLDAVHRRLGAKMGAFAGWDMPIEYQGTLSEHKAVRERVGVFDLSHLGKVEVRGEGAHDALQHALSNDLDRLTEAGAAQYTLCLTDDGGIVDDLIVYGEDDGYLLVPNAANWPKVADAVRASDPGGAEVVPRPDIAVLAVQGPRAPELVEGLFPVAGELAVPAVLPTEVDHLVDHRGGSPVGRADRCRPDARPGRKAHRRGLLPRTQRLTARCRSSEPMRTCSHDEQLLGRPKN